MARLVRYSLTVELALWISESVRATISYLSFVCIVDAFVVQGLISSPNFRESHSSMRFTNFLNRHLDQDLFHIYHLFVVFALTTTA